MVLPWPRHLPRLRSKGATPTYLHQIRGQLDLLLRTPDLVRALDLSTVSSPQRVVTRLQHGIRKPKTYFDGTIRYGHLATISEPKNLADALHNPNWKAAMDIEYGALQKNKTWHLVPPQHGKNIIDCMWVFKVKIKADGTLDKYKARLVAKGYKQ
jgi:hypothetical protein